MLRTLPASFMMAVIIVSGAVWLLDHALRRGEYVPEGFESGDLKLNPDDYTLIDAGFCEVHQVSMRGEYAPIYVARPAEANREIVARSFPNAAYWTHWINWRDWVPDSSKECGGVVIPQSQYARIWVCPQCVRAEAAWRRELRRRH